MNGWILVAGVLLVGLTLADAIRTTLSTTGGGPVSLPVARALWQLVLGYHHARGRRHRRLLLAAGPLTTLVVPALWIVLLWTGWLLVFSAGPGAVVDSQTGAAADLSSRIYYTGYTIFTLGIGNYVPEDGIWEILTAVASLTGFFLITLSVTYLIPVASAATQKQQFAGAIASLGRTPAEILTNAWDGSGFSALTTPLQQYVQTVELHAQRHLTYPMLHYYSGPDRRTSVTLSLAALDEALLLLTDGVAPEARLPASVTGPIRRTLDDFMQTLEAAYLSRALEPPPPPRLDALAVAGIPVVDEAAFARAVAARAGHRRLMHAYAHSEGWTWEDIWKGSSNEPATGGAAGDGVPTSDPAFDERS